jgi:hypothetical protein
MPKKTLRMSSGPSNSDWNDGTFYKVVRLRTGEMLLCTLDADVKSVASETHLTLNHPVHAVPDGSSKEVDGGGIVMMGYKLKNWMDACLDDSYTIDTNMVLTIGNMTTRIKVQYSEFIKIMKHVDANVQRQAEDIEREGALTGLLLSLSTKGEFHVVKGDYQILDGEHAFVPEEIHDQKSTALREEQRIPPSPEGPRDSSTESQTS